MACIVTPGEDAFFIRRILHVTGTNLVYSVSKIIIIFLIMSGIGDSSSH